MLATAGVLLLAACGVDRDSASEAVRGLYSVVIDSPVTGAPTEAQLASMTPFLTSELQELLQGASARRNRDIEEFPNEEPSYADGSLFTSLFEGPTSMAILAGADSQRLAVQFVYDRVPPSISWIDTVVVVEEGGRLVVGDVIYGGTWAFANQGSLVASLRQALDSVSAWTVRLDGFGPVRVGMALTEVEKLLGGTVRIERIEPEDACGYAYLSTMPRGTSLMLDGMTVVRANVDTAGILTEAGFGVGSRETDIVARHGAQVRTEPHPYTGPEGHYLILEDPTRPGLLLIFETDGEVVTSFRAGRLPEIQLIEGCA